MKNLRSLLLSVVALCAAAAFANPAPKPLRMAYCMEPGVCYNRPGGPRTGVAVDWVTRIGAILGRPVEYVDVTQEKAEEMLLTGEVDLIGGIIYRVERAKTV